MWKQNRAAFEHAIAVLVGKPASVVRASSAIAKHTAPARSAGRAIRPARATARYRRSGEACGGIERTDWRGESSRLSQREPVRRGRLRKRRDRHLYSRRQWLLDIGRFGRGTHFRWRSAAWISDQTRALYEQSVDNYRQTVLVAFQEVEDNLAALRVLQEEAKTEDAAVAAAQHSLDLSTTRYKGGVTNYLEVTTAQSAALSDESHRA